MRIARIYVFILIAFIFTSNYIFCQDEVAQDDSLFVTPTIAVTPIYNLTPQEKKLWASLTRTQHYVELVQLDLKNYEAFMRESMDKNLYDMEKIISTIHTAASIYERDKIEYAWSETIKAPIHDLKVIDGYVDEFSSNYKNIKKDQKEARNIMKHKSYGIQNIDVAEKQYKVNEEDLKEVNKKIIYFKNLYNNYKILYAKTVKEKETKINKLITDNRELHKP